MSRQVGSTMKDASDPVQTSHFGRRHERCFGPRPGSLLHDPSQWTIYLGLMLDMICTRFQTHGQLRVLGRQFGKCYETCFGQRLGKLLRTTSRQVSRNIIDAAGRGPGRSFWETLWMTLWTLSMHVAWWPKAVDDIAWVDLRKDVHEVPDTWAT